MPVKGKKYKGAPRSYLEEMLMQQIVAARLPIPERDARFQEETGRKFEIDFWWPSHNLAVEIDGEPHFQYREVRETDYQKNLLLVLHLGIDLQRFSSKQVKSGLALEVLECLLSDKKVADVLRKHRILRT